MHPRIVRHPGPMTDPWSTGRFTTAADLVEDTHGRHDLARLVLDMRTDLIEHPNEWENPTLERFLETLATLLDLDRGTPEGLTWQQLAALFVQTTGYE